MEEYYLIKQIKGFNLCHTNYIKTFYNISDVYDLIDHDLDIWVSKRKWTKVIEIIYDINKQIQDILSSPTFPTKKEMNGFKLMEKYYCDFCKQFEFDECIKTIYEIEVKKYFDICLSNKMYLLANIDQLKQFFNDEIQKYRNIKEQHKREYRNSYNTKFVKCECGAYIQYVNLFEHKKTKKHLLASSQVKNYIDNITKGIEGENIVLKIEDI